MSRWPSTQASRVLSALLRIGWQIKRTTGSHRVLQRTGWSDVVFAFHDRDETGPSVQSDRTRPRGLMKRMRTIQGVGRRFWNSAAKVETVGSAMTIDFHAWD